MKLKKKIQGPIVNATELFDTMLERVSRIDFRSHAGIEDNVPFGKDKYIVLAIEEILNLAKQSGLGLCHVEGDSYAYNGAFWFQVNTDALSKFLADATIKMGIPKDLARPFRFKADLLRQFQFDGYLERNNAYSDKILINLMNGTFEIGLNGRVLRKHTPSDFITYQLPFSFDEAASAPMFRAYLNQVLPDIDCQKVLAEYIGYIFIKSSVLKLEKALFLYGTGANGKSVFFEIVRALLGGTKNVSSYTFHSLCSDNGYSRAKLGSVLVNYSSELGGKIDIEMFKRLVSGEPVEARLPYRQPMMIEDYCKFIINGNHLPDVQAQGHAYFRRLLLIPFTETIADQDQDKELANRIIASELSGIFNWVLEGLDRLLAQRNFTQPKKMSEEIQSYQLESDDVLRFIQEDGWKPGSPGTRLLTIHEFYQDYCKDTGADFSNAKSLSKRLQTLGHKPRRNKYGLQFGLVRDESSVVRLKTHANPFS